MVKCQAKVKAAVTRQYRPSQAKTSAISIKAALTGA